MKVSITVSIDVDPQAWGAEFGTGTAPKAVRDDVDAYVRATLTGSAAAEAGALREVRIASRHRPARIAGLS